jgi:hypothetical protein
MLKSEETNLWNASQSVPLAAQNNGTRSRTAITLAASATQTTGTTTGDYHFEQSKLRSGAPVRLNTSFLSSQVTEKFTPFGRRVELTFDVLKVTVSPDLL